MSRHTQDTAHTHSRAALSVETWNVRASRQADEAPSVCVPLCVHVYTPRVCVLTVPVCPARLCGSSYVDGRVCLYADRAFGYADSAHVCVCADSARGVPVRPCVSLSGSRKNIEEHYDAGNAMYSAFLDQSMTYSCGIHTREQDGDLQVRVGRGGGVEGRVGPEQWHSRRAGRCSNTHWHVCQMLVQQA